MNKLTFSPISRFGYIVPRERPEESQEEDENRIAVLIDRAHIYLANKNLQSLVKYLNHYLFLHAIIVVLCPKVVISCIPTVTLQIQIALHLKGSFFNRLITEFLHRPSPLFSMDRSANIRSNQSDTTDSLGPGGAYKSYGSIPYGGIPENIHEELLVGREDDGWAARRGDARDWEMSTNPLWGENINQKPVDPLVNLRSDFDICGLEWNGLKNRNTSLDHLETSDWAQTQREFIRSLAMEHTD